MYAEEEEHMRSVQVSKANGTFEVVEKNTLPEPSEGQVRIKVQACGICHGDSITKQGLFPGIQYPRVPGHEIAGIIDEIGKNVSNWQHGQRVAVGWHGGHCGECISCRRGDFVMCKYAQVPGIAYDGGYSDYVIAPTVALAKIPKQLSYTEAAPLMCAGITTYNALRNSGRGWSLCHVGLEHQIETSQERAPIRLSGRSRKYGKLSPAVIATRSPLRRRLAGEYAPSA